MTVFSNTFFQSNKIIWCPDGSLGLSRLGGLDPRSLSRITKLAEIPSNFPVSPELFGKATYTDVKNGLNDEIENGNVFIVNYKILEIFAGKTVNGIPVVGAPLCLFWWHNFELLPVVMQIYQKPDPVNNPLVTPRDELKWQAAKIYFQNATAVHHLSCPHEFDSHLITGAFSIAVPRNLSANHPISVLLYPHLQFTVANSSIRFIKARLEQESSWYTGGVNKTMSQELMAKHALDVDYYTLAFDVDVKLRNVENNPPENCYPFRDDGKLLWDAITEFVKQYLALYYVTDDDVTTDEELQNLLEELGSENGGRLHGLLPNGEGATKMTKVEELHQFVSTIIWIAGPYHAAHHFPQDDYITDPLHIHPLSTRKEWPLYKDDTPIKPNDIKDILPTKRDAVSVASLISIGFRYDKFGDYSRVPLGKVGIHKVAVDNFQKKLSDIDRIIEERNKVRPLPYNYLRPSLIPNAANV